MSKISGIDVISWAGKNHINNLVYGNGGIKCWPKSVVMNMRTHENAPTNDPRAQVDFCWNINYVQMNNVYSNVMNNGSPLQAWRAGFREGVKMGLVDGDVVDPNNLMKNVHGKNLKRLLTWMSVGEDVTNGLWAVYGARLGCHMTNVRREEWDWKNVRDFKWLNEFFNTKVFPMFEGGDQLCQRTGMRWNYQDLLDSTIDLGVDIRRDLKMPLADLGREGSEFFKAVYVNPSRMAPTVREDQVEMHLEA